MTTIYLDVLLIQNLYVNYFLLRAAARLTHSPLHWLRCGVTALVTSLFSLLILLPPLPFALQLLVKIVCAVLTVSLAFGFHRNVWLKQVICFFLCNFLLAGLLLAVCSQTKQGFAAWGNSCWYLNFSLFHLILFTGLAYSLLHLLQFFHSRNALQDNFQVCIRLEGKTVVMPGLADTGNTLMDLFSGAPVIVCSEASLAELLQGRQPRQLRGYRLLPCATVTAEGLLPLFRPDEVCVRNLSNRKSRQVDAMIGIGGTQESAVFHPKLF